MTEKEKEVPEERSKTLEEAHKEIERLKQEVKYSEKLTEESRERYYRLGRQQRLKYIARRCEEKWRPFIDLWSEFVNGPYERLVGSLTNTLALRDFNGFHTPTEFVECELFQKIFETNGECKGAFAELKRFLDEGRDEGAIERAFHRVYAYYLQTASPRLLAGGECEQVDYFISHAGLTPGEREVFELSHGLGGWQRHDEVKIRVMLKMTRRQYHDTIRSATQKVAEVADGVGWAGLRSVAHLLQMTAEQFQEDNEVVKKILEVLDWSAGEMELSREELMRHFDEAKKATAGTKGKREEGKPAKDLNKQIRDLVMHRRVLFDVVQWAAQKMGITTVQLFDQSRDDLMRQAEEAEKKESPPEKKEDSPEST